ncbi:hypothetical protein [Pantoea ananatis]|uniref:hypothetical protein n=1 Tax=Pantoea ananas TaxID=553 RepID=UPI000E266D5A|nr:hypothetical protein [Pantoea ananatis]REE77922.1 hypothetical protein C7424_0943 [Pantoea ananatis]BBL31240.1 hypothetical protein PAFU01_26880 [Pantoea ananatis]
MLSNKSNKELVEAGHQFAKALDADMPLTEIAKLVSALSTRLDCAIVRGDELQQKLDLARDKYRAEGIAASINHLMNKFEGIGMIGIPVMSLQWLLKEITSGTHDTADKAGV